jgi:hypothetical protein
VTKIVLATWKKCAAATKMNAADSKTHCLKAKCDAAGDMAVCAGYMCGGRRWRAPHSISKARTDQAGGAPRVTLGKPPASLGDALVGGD